MIFLSHVTPSGGISSNPSKFDAMLQWETPKSIIEIRSFLGLAGYYKRFIERTFKIRFAFNSVDSKMSSLCVGCSV